MMAVQASSPPLPPNPSQPSTTPRPELSYGMTFRVPQKDKPQEGKKIVCQVIRILAVVRRGGAVMVSYSIGGAGCHTKSEAEFWQAYPKLERISS